MGELWMGMGMFEMASQVKSGQVRSSQVIVYSSSPDYCASSRPLPIALRTCLQVLKTGPKIKCAV